MKKKLIILFVFCCCLIIASKGSENGYLELAKMDDEIIKHIDKKGYWCTSQIEKKLNSLLNLSISKTEIWGHNLNIKGIPSFRMFLRPKIKNNVKSIPNPYFGYALFTFLSSKRFKEGESKLQQETCLQLLGYYLSISDNLKCYNVYHKKIIQLLFIKCHDKKYYNDKSLEIIKETIVKNKIPSKRYLLLLWIINEKLDSKIKKALMRLADNCNDFDKKDLTPWFALIFLAKNGEKKYLDQLINIAKRVDNTQGGIRKATYMFPYLTMVQKPEVIELMQNFLRNKKIIDQGNDIVYRYTGLSYLAAKVLYTMLNKYEKFSLLKFNQDEREKCFNWFQKNSPYKFRKIDYWTRDPIISRMRYMIFYVR